MAETDAQRKARLLNRLDEVVQEIEQLNSINASTRKGAGINASGDGVNLDHSQYKRDLYDEETRLRDTISSLDGPFIENLEIYN